MKTPTLAKFGLFLAVMLAIAFLSLPMQAKATGKPETPAATPTQQQTQGQQQAQQQGQSQAQAIDLSLMNAPAGASLRQGNSYSFAAGAAPLPPGLCPKGGSVSILFGALAWSNTGTEMECLDKVLAMLRDTTTPRTEVRYVSISPPPAAPSVEPKAPAKPEPKAEPVRARPQAKPRSQPPKGAPRPQAGSQPATLAPLRICTAAENCTPPVLPR